MHTPYMAHFSLNKEQRLKSRKLIGKVFSDGKAVQSFPIRSVCLFSDNSGESETGDIPHPQVDFPGHTSTSLQAGFSVSTRNFKKAVDRNRIKRLMKEVYRRSRPELEAGLAASKKKLALFFIFTGKELPEYELVEAKMHLVIKRILEQIDGNAQKNI